MPTPMWEVLCPTLSLHKPLPSAVERGGGLIDKLLRSGEPGAAGTIRASKATTSGFPVTIQATTTRKVQYTVPNMEWP